MIDSCNKQERELKQQKKRERKKITMKISLSCFFFFLLPRVQIRVILLLDHASN